MIEEKIIIEISQGEFKGGIVLMPEFVNDINNEILGLLIRKEILRITEKNRNVLTP